MGRSAETVGPASASDLLSAVAISHLATRAFSLQVNLFLSYRFTASPKRVYCVQTVAVPGDFVTLLRFWLTELGRVNEWFRSGGARVLANDLCAIALVTGRIDAVQAFLQQQHESYQYTVCCFPHFFSNDIAELKWLRL